VNLRQREAFRAVMISGGITDAGRLLNVSQPSVSRLIADLERNIGYRLFERRGGRIIPTPEAVSLYDEVERSFIGIAKIAETAREIRNFRPGRLWIAAMPSLCFDLIPGAIGQLVARYPSVRITVQTRSSQRIMNWMQSQRFDVGLAGAPFDHGGVDCLLRVSVPCVCALPISHRLATKKAIRVKDLAGEAIILGTQDLMLRPRLDALFRSEGVEPNVPIETSLSYVACHLAEQGLGIAIVEPFTAHRFSGDRLAVRPFAADVSFSFGMLAPQNRPVSALTRTFADILDRQLRNLVLLNGIRPSIS
jgi:DNA-binding transcriptional LysR family regulator